MIIAKYTLNIVSIALIKMKNSGAVLLINSID